MKSIFRFSESGAIMGYSTKQSKEILNCLEQNKDKHLTADEVYSILNSNGVSVGRTTVYRHLEKLYEEAAVRKFKLDESTSACYQLSDSQKGCHNHYHLKCTVCGKLLHAECDFLNELSQHIFNDHNFYVDSEKTVLYGICEDCRR